MTQTKHKKWHILWIIPPIIVGILVLKFMASGKEPPSLTDEKEPSRAVRIVSFNKTDFTPIARGFGVVEPAQQWRAVAQVSGKIISMHPQLRNGEILVTGTELFRIDPVDYELNLLNAQSELAELDVQKKNSEASLKIEKTNLDLAEKELKRQQKLKTQGLSARSKVDEASRSALNSRAAVQNLNNSLALMPTQRKRLQYKIQQAQRDLNNSIITAPFNIRITGLSIEKDQFVSKGQELFQGDSVDRVEINAQLPFTSLKNLFYGRPDLPRDIKILNEQLQEITGFRPKIQLDMGDDVIAEWDAEFVRISDQVDPKTRTLGVVVAVDHPMQKTIPGKRPPLSKGMFVQVQISGHDQNQQLVIPRSIIRNNRIYLMDSDNRLQTRLADILYQQGEFAVLKNGLNDGDNLVVTDLVPAVNGMLLTAEPDLKLQSFFNAE